MKVVISTCYGGYGLSYAAMLRYCELKGIEVWPLADERWPDSWTYWLVPESERPRYSEELWNGWSMAERRAYNEEYGLKTIDHYKIDRTDPVLVQVVEELGDDAAGRFAELKIVDVPDDVLWDIQEYDGWESVHEKHRVWG